MKSKNILIILIVAVIITGGIFTYTLIEYIKTTNPSDTSNNSNKELNQVIKEVEHVHTAANNTVIPVDKDSSIRIITEFDQNMFKGRKSLVFFWASWCSHCRDEFEVVQTALKDYQNRGYNIYLVSHDHNQNDLAEFMKNNDLNYEVYFDEQRIIRANFDPEASSVPRTYIIDENAKLIDSHNGAITLEELNNLIDKNM